MNEQNTNSISLEVEKLLEEIVQKAREENVTIKLIPTKTDDLYSVEVIIINHNKP